MLQASDPQKLSFEKAAPTTAQTEAYQKQVYARLIDELQSPSAFPFHAAVKQRMDVCRADKKRLKEDSRWVKEAEQHIFAYVVDEDCDGNRGSGVLHKFAGKWAWLDHGESLSLSLTARADCCSWL